MIIGFGDFLKDYLEFNNISQVDFAERLDISPKHLNEILNKQIDISVELMLAISILTDIDVNFIAKVERSRKLEQYLQAKFKTEKELKNYLKDFSINELNKKNWFVFRDETSLQVQSLDILNYLKFRDFDALNNYQWNVLFKKRDDASLIKILLWMTRCDYLSKGQKIEIYNSKNIPLLLEELKEERNKKFNIDNLTKIFNKYGIYFVIEEPLKATKIRGLFKVNGKVPCIYLTTMYKTKSSIYYSLYHELGHCKSDYNKAKSKIIVNGDDFIEERAERFAINQMIDEKVWEKIVSNVNEKELLKISKEYKIPMEFITSRLAKEKMITYKSELYNKYKEEVVI